MFLVYWGFNYSYRPTCNHYSGQVHSRNLSYNDIDNP